MLSIIFYLLLLAVLKCVLVSSASVLLLTNNPDREIIIFDFPENSNLYLASQFVASFYSDGDYSESSINSFVQILTAIYPGFSFRSFSRNNLTEEEIMNILGNSARVGVEELDTRMPRGLDDWKLSINRPSAKLPIKVKRSSIISDAVQAYKDLDRIPFIIPRHLFNRNIKVTFIDEAGEDYGGLRNEFFSLFFRNIIENSGLFAVNSEGYVIVAKERASVEDLDMYEAFGFYLAKAFQNNVPIGYHLAQLIAELIKFGKFKIKNLDLLESWDYQLNSSLRSLSYMSSDELSDYNFKDINPRYASLAVNPMNVKMFTVAKFRNEIISNYQAQLLMIVVGFVRACPGHLLATSDIDLAEAFRGNNNLTADEMISAFIIEGPRNIKTLYLFAQWLGSLNTNQLMIFFRYVTGLRVIPPGGLKNLNLKIIFLAPGTEHMLPQANTCLKHFMLPPYSTEEQAMERFNVLLRQLESGDAFGFGFA